jgi:hypothetical protein
MTTKKRDPWAESRFQALVYHPEGTVRLHHGLRRHPVGLPGAVLRLQCFIIQHFPARNLMIRHQSQPWTEVLLAEIKAKIDSPLWDCLP